MVVIDGSNNCLDGCAPDLEEASLLWAPLSLCQGRSPTHDLFELQKPPDAITQHARLHDTVQVATRRQQRQERRWALLDVRVEKCRQEHPQRPPSDEAQTSIVTSIAEAVVPALMRNGLRYDVVWKR